MKEGLFYKKLKDNQVLCELCPHFCIVKNNETGKCGVRQNIDGKLFSLYYGKPCSVSIDPIEKKPLYHFFPGEKCLSIATIGCNLKCLNCQNWEISQKGEANDADFKEISAKEIVKIAQEKGIKIMAYTYTEPTIFYESMLDIAKEAKKKGLKNVIVSNGFINPAPLKKLCKCIDAANIDLKSIKDAFYGKVCSAKLQPVLETLKILKKEKVWLEITNLLIPKMNDSDQEIKELTNWIVKNLGQEVPLHFSAFYPQYKLNEINPTPHKTLLNAWKIAAESGLKYICIGNVDDEERESSFCPKCKKSIIKRRLFSIIENHLKNRRCSRCNEKIEGVWDMHLSDPPD